MSAKILIVEDDRSLLSVMRMRMQELGCRCIACSNASEAMSQFAACDVDLIITDLTMPGIDGLGVLGLIRSQSDVPVIVVTGKAEKYRQLIEQYPRVTLISKPFESHALIACVSELIPVEAKII